MEGHWITAKELGAHLGYADPRKAVNNIYERNSDFFETGLDCSDLKLRSEAGVRNMRVFSRRGVLKVLRYSSTEVADKAVNK